MSKKLTGLNAKLIEFITLQHMFFVATADVDGRVNISPKGLDSFRVINNNQVMWLNLTGSGNETAAHVQSLPRMTIMFNDFADKPLILRLYGQAHVLHKNDPQWHQAYLYFDDFLDARQIFILDIDLVITSCGMAVPLYGFKKQREALVKSAKRKGQEGIKTYWVKKNQVSIDGKPTHIVAKNLG